MRVFTRWSSLHHETRIRDSRAGNSTTGSEQCHPIIIDTGIVNKKGAGGQLSIKGAGVPCMRGLIDTQLVKEDLRGGHPAEKGRYCAR